ncbi:MAG: toxin-antitoxin system YwqK family antitoxin [Holosporales bacterium]|jgi:antitoxin component YwqK of YwqJK toxin-antitoxin module|nr:toxin-antitoxin system YwqK family antitoxin [Holosporales bacterium]
MEDFQKAAKQVDTHAKDDALFSNGAQPVPAGTKDSNRVYSTALTANSHTEDGEVLAADEPQAAISQEGSGGGIQDASADSVDGNGSTFDVTPGIFEKIKEVEGPIELPAEIPTELPAEIQSEIPAELPAEEDAVEPSQAPPPIDGIHEYTAEDGRKYVVTYENGQRCGLTQIFDKDGVIEKEITFANNKINGLCITYENGIKRTETEFKNDEIDGVAKSFDETGALTTETVFKNGIKQGEMKQYHKTGEVQVIANFENDKMSGDFATFTETGSPLLIAKYQTGEIHGTMQSFFTGIDGNGVQREAVYELGKLHGSETVFYSNGAPQSISCYEYGQLKAPPTVFKKGAKPK